MSHHQPIMVNDFVEVDFDWSLKQQTNYKECAKACTLKFQRGLPNSVSPADFLLQLKKIYNKNKPSILDKHGLFFSQPKIPYIIHQIWFGSKLPEVYRIWQKRLKKLHPKWQIINWTEAKLKREFPKGLINKKMFAAGKKVNNYAQMADIARYEILYKFGGLYLDYDTKCFKSFEPLHNMYTFFAGLESFKTSCYCCNTAVGSVPEHPIIKRSIDLIKSHESQNPDLSHWQCKEDHSREACKRIISTGQKLFTQAIIEKIDQVGKTDIVFPQEYFYPDKQTIASLCYHAAHSSWKDRVKDHFNEQKNPLSAFLHAV